ncbi:hypothetical protein DERP_014616 [Dermatophagoides pteronyssinus]|uniref:Uncharacterized protein n=1 Tax=Dermatophagoides pteronyssinus TaxID=6956 RepID=A0ABQ8IVX9_DERPT|nr:hypothetical protein DERP_014616 [Dermatophagoides pteronyssinus]
MCASIKTFKQTKLTITRKKSYNLVSNTSNSSLLLCLLPALPILSLVILSLAASRSFTLNELNFGT